METNGPSKKASQQWGLLFIVGVGRSGTSLLQSMLNAHENVCFLPETQFFRKYVLTSELERFCQNENLDALLTKLSDDKGLKRLGLIKQDLADAINSCNPDFFSRDLYLSLFDRYSRKKGQTLWVGDKDPRIVEYLPAVKRFFPSASIIHIVRDPRDVLVSKKKAGWSKDQSIIRQVFANRIQLKIGRANGKKLFKTQYIEILYEELIRDPASCLSEVCRFLRISFDRNMLDFGASSRELVSDDEMQWKKETLGPLLNQNCGKWNQGLEPHELALCESACSEAFEYYPYSKAENRKALTQKDRLWVLLFLVAINVMDPLYRLNNRWKMNL